MNKTFTSSEVREFAAQWRGHALTVSEKFAVMAMISAYADRLEADEQAQAQSGEWVMVPHEPDREMMDDAANMASLAGVTISRNHICAIYQTMLAAAPQPPAAEPVVWPFVESPGEIADRLKQALENGCPLLGAVRQVFIENPPLYTHPQPAQDAKDAARMEWYFGPSDKKDWLDTYMLGMREVWSVGQWRAAIDAAMAKERPNG